LSQSVKISFTTLALPSSGTLRSSIDDMRCTASINPVRLVRLSALIYTNRSLPPSVSEFTPCSASCLITRDGSAPGTTASANSTVKRHQTSMDGPIQYHGNRIQRTQALLVKCTCAYNTDEYTVDSAAVSCRLHRSATTKRTACSVPDALHSHQRPAVHNITRLREVSQAGISGISAAKTTRMHAQVSAHTINTITSVRAAPRCRMFLNAL